ncbi:MAG: endonuclease domain-containing protein [Bacteroidota bacterium]
MTERELHKGANPNMFGYAKENRKAPTDAEDLLWQNLRGRKLVGLKFRRQHPIGDFIIDFYCHDKKLGIELDGGYHFLTEQREADEGLTFELKELGVKIIRFDNSEIERNIKKVLKRIEEELK